MKPQFDRADANGEIVFDRYLGGTVELDLLQRLLAALAPRWCSRLRIWRSPKDQRPVDIGRPGALGKALVAAATERGALYGDLIKRYGQPPLERASGSVELRGAGPEMIAIVSIDEMIVSPLGKKKQLGNHISLQVRRPNVEGSPGSEWLRRALEVLCAEMSPVWGEAGHPDEYWAKVMSESPRVEAIGRDFGRFLPGLFWLNFFGRRYRELIGVERLRSAPAYRVIELKDGVLIELGPDPTAWNTAEYAARELMVRDYLGQRFFFSRDQPGEVTQAPDWKR